MSHDTYRRRLENQETQKSVVDQRLDDLRQIMSTAPGRRYMKGLLTFHGIFSTSQAKTSTDLSEEKGRRNAGIRILEEMKQANPELALKLLLNI
jgi:hypothetical protein